MGERVGKIEKIEDLIVWREAHESVLRTYRLTARVPKEELYGLISQMRRAAVSVAANIAEGFARTGKGEKLNFYNIAQGSLSELRYYYLLSKDLGYLSEVSEHLNGCDRTARMLHQMMDKIRDRKH